MSKIVVVTGAGAGVGRAVVAEFAGHGYDVALLSRDPERLERAAYEARRHGVRALPIPADVADAEAVEAAAERVERELGPIDVWVNVAFSTVFSPVADLTPEEVLRGTQVTYLGQVHGMMSALKRMRPRGRGAIVNVGSALTYRSVPLQSIYCGAKAAIRGFTDSLRSELIHDGLDIHVCMVDLPAVNTPQFNWAVNKLGFWARPVPPVYQPEVPARAVYFGATHRRREIWVGWPTMRAIWVDRIAPAFADRYLARHGYASQTTDRKLPPNHEGNLWNAVKGDYGAHGRFDAESRDGSWEMFTDRHRDAFYAGAAMLAGLFVLRRFAQRGDARTSAARDPGRGGSAGLPRVTAPLRRR